MSNVERFPTPKRPPPIIPFEPFSPIGARAKPRDWLVEDCFLRGTVALVNGDGGLGKSLLLQQLQTATALGKPWLGHTVKRCRSLALYCEEPREELERRQWDINQHYGCDDADIKNLVMMQSLIAELPILMRFPKWGDEGVATDLLHQLEHAVDTHKIQLLIIDTLADVFSGNEIDRNQPAAFFRPFFRLALKMQGCVIFSQHPSNDGMATGSGRSGSTAWHNKVRSRLYLTAPSLPKSEEDGIQNVRHLKTMKRNYGPMGGKLKLRWEKGVFVREDQDPFLSPEWQRN